MLWSLSTIIEAGVPGSLSLVYYFTDGFTLEKMMQKETLQTSQKSEQGDIFEFSILVIFFYKGPIWMGKQYWNYG